MGTERRERAKQAKQAAILEAARNLFNERGFQAACMEDIAERAGLAKGTVYLYFRGKEALFNRLCEQTLQETLDERREIVRRTPDPAQALRLFWEEHVRRVRENPILLLLAGPISGEEMPPESVRMRELAREHKGLILDIFQRGVKEGRFRAFDPAELAHLYIGALRGVFTQFVDSEGAMSPTLMASKMLDIFFHGILAPAGGSNTPSFLSS